MNSVIVFYALVSVCLSTAYSCSDLKQFLTNGEKQTKFILVKYL